MEHLEFPGIILLVTLLTVLVLLGIWFFGKYIFRSKASESDAEHFFGRYMHDMMMNKSDVGRAMNAMAKYLIDRLERRNDFWTSYGQMVICIFIVGILAILLLTKTISAEAGLPILSAISGFAIAKGASTTNKGGDGFPTNNNNG